MAFNNLFTPKNKKPPVELFLAVEIHESMIKTAVWQVDDESPSVVSVGSYELWDSEDSLVNGVDASLTEAVRGLSSEPDRVIFGLPDSWLSDSRVHPTKQKIIKRLLSELSLKAIGMVTITEAIVSHLKTQEGIPPTAILLEIYPSKVIVSLVNLGEIQAQEEVGRSDDLPKDVEEGLARLDAEKLPARFILTNGSDLENEEQQIVSYPWVEKLPFIHIPKVQVLPIDFSIRAIAISGGSEAAKSIGVEIAEETPSVDTVEAYSGKEVFVEQVTTDITSMGFALEDGIEEAIQIEEYESVNVQRTVETESPAHNEHVVAPEKKKFRLNLPTVSLPKFSFPRFKKGVLPAKSPLIFVPVLILAVIVVGIIGYYLYFGKVNVMLTLSPVRVSQTLDIIIGTSPRQDTLFLQATNRTISAKVSESIATTGEVVVGDKATGKVIIYNLSSQAFNLKAGTKIASGNIVFTLDAPVTIASTSGQISDSGTLVLSSAPGTVTATRIGVEGNLEKGTGLTVENYPKTVMQAKAESEFVGGTSKTVKAAVKADQEKLLSLAEEKIRSSIDNQLKADNPDNRFIPTAPIKYSLKNFDKQLGQESNTLNLDLAAELDVLVYSRRELVSLVENKIINSQGSSLTANSDSTQITLSDPNSIDKATFQVKADVQTELFPKIQQEQISESVKGKPVEGLRSLLQTIPGYQNATVYISPDIPLLSNILPLNTQLYHFLISK